MGLWKSAHWISHGALRRSQCVNSHNWLKEKLLGETVI
jgi:hypothetical protein